MTPAEFERAYERITPHGWLSWGEADLLVRTAERTSGDMVEVGSYQGRSAMLLCQVRDGNLRRRLYCIDPWDDHFHSELKGEEIYRRFLANVARIPGADVVPVRMRVEDWEPVPAGFVYLDGDHTRLGTLQQIVKALMCKPQWMAIHDVKDSGEGVHVKEACLGALGPWHKRVESLAVWEVSR